MFNVANFKDKIQAAEKIFKQRDCQIKFFKTIIANYFDLFLLLLD